MPPTYSESRSRTVTGSPSRLSAYAPVSPAGPAPMTITRSREHVPAVLTYALPSAHEAGHAVAGELEQRDQAHEDQRHRQEGSAAQPPARQEEGWEGHEEVPVHAQRIAACRQREGE